MDHEGVKVQIIRRFLQFVASYYPLKSATMATLGGEGLEASLWEKAGIIADHGWLIERMRKAGKRLITNHKYHFCSSLIAFPRLLTSVLGDKVGIDAFHLDLCGTLEASWQQFTPVVPLITSGNARCLAVTVADQRWNASLKNAYETGSADGLPLDKSARTNFFKRITKEQESLPRTSRRGLPLDPANGARREFGFAMHMIRVFKDSPIWPDRIERFIYVSRYNGHHFRMRTYLFHLSEETGSYPEKALTLVRHWEHSALTMFIDGISVLVDAPTEEPMEYGKLSTIAAAVGGDALQEFNALIAAAKGGKRSASLEEGLKAIAKIANDLLGNRPADEKKSSSLPAVILENGELVKLQFSLLRAKVRNDLDNAYEQAFQNLGLTGRKHFVDRKRIVGAHLARTQGRFRGNFVSRVLASQGENALVELAEIYTQIDGRTVTPELLKKEATATK